MFMRLVAATIGAIGLISLFNGIVSFRGDIVIFIEAFRAVTRTVWENLFEIFDLEVKKYIMDYLSMGLITAGMRIRTTLFMWDAVKKEIWNEIIVPIPFSKKRITVKKNGKIKFYAFVIPWRFIFTLLFWPRRIFISGSQYLTGRWQRNFDGDPWNNSEKEKVSKNQYLIFFETLAIAVILVGINYAIFFVT